MRLLARLGFVNRSGVVSSEWLKQHAQREREEHHNVCISWPINKAKDSQGYWNSKRLRKRA